MPPLSGKIQRELAMFRGAHTWAKGALFKAVERGRRAAGAAAHDDASDSDDGEYASVRAGRRVDLRPDATTGQRRAVPRGRACRSQKRRQEQERRRVDR